MAVSIPPLIAPSPLYWAGALTVIGFFVARPFRHRRPMTYFLIELLVFAVLSGLMLLAGVVPYRPAARFPDEPVRLLSGALEIVWWLAGAWLSVGFLRAFVLLGRQRRDSKLVQDLLAALIYLAAGFAIVAYVFGLPVTGLLATSGVAAIIIGLALQSSLGDVFSGIVLNIERPYRVGDWIILDDHVQGKVIETNWRATHILTVNRDEAIVPNSMIAKSRVVNCSTPARSHGATLRIRLEPSLTPDAGCTLLKAALLGSAHILRTPEPTVAIKDISKEAIEFELAYAVADLDAADLAQTEIFKKAARAVAAAGGGFAPRLAGASSHATAKEKDGRPTTERLLGGVSLFATLSPEEKSALSGQMRRKRYKAGQVVVATGTVLQVLCIVSSGVLAATIEKDGRKIEVSRLAPGDYFGELGLLTGEPLTGEVVAVTNVTIYELSKEALAPLLKARPSLADELSESRQIARHTVLDQQKTPQPEERLASRLATRIRSLFPAH